MKLVLLAALAVLAAADVKPLTTFNTPQNSLSGSSNLFSYSSTAAPELSLPFKEAQDFGARFGGFGAIGYSTPAPYLSGGLVSSTPAPFLNDVVVSSTPSPIFNGVSSTAAPSLDFNSLAAVNNVEFSGLGYSTPAPIADSALFYSTAAPQAFNYAPLASYDSSSFNLGSVATSGGSINEAFGVSSYEARPQEVSKEAYFFSAPEDYEPVQTRINVAPETPIKKNIRYIFIKAPSAPSLGRVEIAAPPQAEEKTVVYVLAKKPEPEQQIVVKSAPTTEAPKPEVYFIKYENQEEAEAAIAKARGGSLEGRVSAHSHGGSDEFVGSINREAARAQPVISYSNEGQKTVVPFRLADDRFRFNAPSSSFSSQLLSQPAVQLNRGFAFTTPAQFQSFPTASPTVNIDSGFRRVFSGYDSPLISGSAEPAFVTSTTAAPLEFQGFSAASPTVNIGSGFKSVFSSFNGVSEPSFVSSTVAPQVAVSSTPVPFSSYGLRK